MRATVARIHSARLSSRAGLTLIEILVAISVVGILLAMAFPALSAIRASARRTICLNNVRNLAIACFNYESTNGHFPPGCVYGHGSAWSAYILEEIEQESLDDRLDLSDSSMAPTGDGNAVNWTSDPNEGICATFIELFRCPADPVVNHIDSGPGPRMAKRVPSSYIGVASGTTKTQADLYWSGSKTRDFVSQARSGVLAPTQRASYFGTYRLATEVGYDDILDGTSTTLLIGEAVFDTSHYESSSRGIDHWYIGSYQVDYNQDISEFVGSTKVPLNLYHQYGDERLATVTNTAQLFSEMAFGFASWHPDDGVNFVFVDGSTKFINAEIDPTLFQYMGDRRDGQDIEPY